MSNILWIALLAVVAGLIYRHYENDDKLTSDIVPPDPASQKKPVLQRAKTQLNATGISVPGMGIASLVSKIF